MEGRGFVFPVSAMRLFRGLMCRVLCYEQGDGVVPAERNGDGHARQDRAMLRDNSKGWPETQRSTVGRRSRWRGQVLWSAFVRTQRRFLLDSGLSVACAGSAGLSLRGS